jgi:hypothetical protein
LVDFDKFLNYYKHKTDKCGLISKNKK